MCQWGLDCYNHSSISSTGVIGGVQHQFLFFPRYFLDDPDLMKCFDTAPARTNLMFDFESMIDGPMAICALLRVNVHVHGLYLVLFEFML